MDITTSSLTSRRFFHENVGISAWGLAIHEKSRIFAVSSNNREVTVFVHAISTIAAPLVSRTSKFMKAPPIGTVREGLAERAELQCKAIANRQVNFVKSLRVGPEGHNIPSIAFADDVHGNAQHVLATDILGNLWYLDIWDQTETVKRRMSNDFDEAPAFSAPM